MWPSRTFGKDTPRRGRCVWIALVLLCAIGAAAAARRIVALGTAPSAGFSDFGVLDVHFADKAGMTLIHIVPSLLFVLLVPLQFVSSLRQRHPRLHRWTGRGIVVLGLVLAISALWLSAHPVGGLAEGTATIFLRLFFSVCPRQGMVAYSERAGGTASGVGHAHGRRCPGRGDYAAHHGRLLRHQQANGPYTTAVLWASDVARIHFNLSSRRDLDQLHPLTNR